MTIIGWICTVACLVVDVAFAVLLVMAAFARRSRGSGGVDGSEADDAH